MQYYENYIDSSFGFTFLFKLEITSDKDDILIIQSELNKHLVTKKTLKVNDGEICMIVEFCKLKDFKSTLLVNIYTNKNKYTVYLKNFDNKLVLGINHNISYSNQFQGLLPNYMKLSFFAHSKQNKSIEVGNLTPLNILENLIQTLGHSMPSETKYNMAMYIVLNCLGAEFWAKECTSFGTPQNFFKVENQGYSRIVQLSTFLWDLKDCKNFSHQLAKCKRDQNFEKVFYELLAASWIRSLSERVDFNIESGIKGDDFDLISYNILGFDRLNVEVKSKDKPFQTLNSFDNYFTKYKKQLNRENPGAFFCKVVGLDHFSIDQLIEASSAFLKKNSRIKFIAFAIEENTDSIISYSYIFVDCTGPMDVYITPFSLEVPGYVEEALEIVNDKFFIINNSHA